jgi:hypothetical protein
MRAIPGAPRRLLLETRSFPVRYILLPLYPSPRGSSPMCSSAVLIIVAALLAADDPVAAPAEPAMRAAADYSKSNRGQTMVVRFDGKVIFERYEEQELRRCRGRRGRAGRSHQAR